MDEMVIIGMDPHKASNTIAALDSIENSLTRRRFENSDDDFVEMLTTVGEYPNRVWAVEDANGMGRSIAQRLVGYGERVSDVPAKLATRVRVYSTGHGSKTDALAIARTAQHSRHLHIVKPGDETVVMAFRLRQGHIRLAAAATMALVFGKPPPSTVAMHWYET